jgi:hypothetical protein
MTTISISENLPMTLSQGDLGLLKKAHRHLEHPSLAVRLTNVVGTPLEIAFKLLPKDWYQKLHNIAESSIMKALEVAVGSLKESRQIKPRNRFHKVLGMCSGGVGGCFGLPSLLVEIPVSTTIMLRSIAEIARSQNEDIEQLETRLACLEVFSLGARSAEDDAAETGYYGIRIALSLSLRNAQHHIFEHGLKGETPLLVKLVRVISSRFGIALSEKAAAQAIPLIGAVGGAAINVVFIQHFQDIAWSHFTMRRLERLYGQELVRSEYELLSKEESL